MRAGRPRSQDAPFPRIFTHKRRRGVKSDGAPGFRLVPRRRARPSARGSDILAPGGGSDAAGPERRLDGAAGLAARQPGAGTNDGERKR